VLKLVFPLALHPADPLADARLGSVAAAWQSTMGGVVAGGSLFAMLQAAGATLGTVIPAVGGGLMAAGLLAGRVGGGMLQFAGATAGRMLSRLW